MANVTVRCSKCDAEIEFFRHFESGKSNPVDVLPSEKGNLVLDRPGNRYRVATAEEIEVARRDGKNLYISHFVTCPNAGEFRRKK